MPIRPPVKTVEWVGPAETGLLRLLDQTRLPTETAFLDCPNSQAVWDAIRRLVVRGAPAIGVAAGCCSSCPTRVVLGSGDTLLWQVLHSASRSEQPVVESGSRV